MSNTIKVIHMCNHVVPETEIRVETSEFLAGKEVCQISENPIHNIDRVEFWRTDPTLKHSVAAILIKNRLKVDDFSYEMEKEVFSDPIELCESKTIFGLPENAKVKGKINGAVFQDGFMFFKFGVRPSEEITTTGCVITPLDSRLVFAGDGSNGTFSFSKELFLSDFTNAFLSANFRIPETATSLKLTISVPPFNDVVIYEKTSFEKTPKMMGSMAVITSAKVAIPGTENFNAYTSGGAYLKVSLTMPNAALASGALLEMRFDVPGSRDPLFFDLNGTGYEHLSKETLSYIFLAQTGRKSDESSDYDGDEVVSIVPKSVTAKSGYIIHPGSPPSPDAMGLSLIDPETMTPILRVEDMSYRVFLYITNIAPETNYHVWNNMNYGNVVYWFDVYAECISVSRGEHITSPKGVSFAGVCSNPGERYHDDLRYYLKAEGDISEAYMETELLGCDVERLDGIPFGIKNFYEIETSITSVRVKKLLLSQDDIVALHTGKINHDIIEIAPLPDAVLYTSFGKEHKVFSPIATEKALTSQADDFSIASRHVHFFSDPENQCIKFLVPKNFAVNLEDAKIKFEDTLIYYECDFPEETSAYTLLLEDMDFTRLGQNAIKWIPLSEWATMQDDRPLKATFETKHSINRRYDEYSCPRCSGNGWYVSTTADASKAVENVTGSDKMVQDFLKILLTDIRYYKPGTAFVTLKGFVKRDQKIEDLIVLYIKDAETQLRQLQYNMSIAGSEISEYEELKTVIIESIDATSSQDRIYVEIRLVNMASEYTSIGLAV